MRTARAVSLGMALLALIALSATPASAELKVTIGGYVKLDMEYQDKINNAGASRTAAGANTFVFDEGPNKDRVRATNDQFLMDVRETRFNITATDKVGEVNLKGFIEVDFFGGVDAESNALVSNSSVPRLRHAMAFGTIPVGIGNLTILAGQYWSAFGNIPVIQPPPTIDFSSQTRLFARQPQLKLTYGIPVGKDTLNLIGAVQAQSVNFLTTSPVASPLSGAVSAAREEGEHVPAFVAKLQWLSSRIKAEVAGIFSEARGITPRGSSESEFVYGLQGTATVTFGPLTLHGHADSMNGITREATGSFPDAVFRGPDKDVATINTLGAWGGFSYKLTPTLNLYGLYENRSADSSGHSGFGRGTAARTDLVREQLLHVNIVQTLWTRVDVGIEYERAWIDAFRNNHGAVNIYHAAFWYFF